MKSPAFQFYAAEFLADENVVLMSNQEVGCYIKLMAYCWREGSIPADVAKIARLCGEDSSAMAQLWLSIKQCFVLANGSHDRLTHPRLEKEREKQSEFKKERAEAGKKGAAARWNKGKEDDKASGSANGSAMAEGMANDASSSSSSSSMSSPSEKKARAPRFDARGFLLSHGASEKTVDAWLEIRRGKRLKQTDVAMEGTVDEAKKAGMTLEAALTLCCKRGWGGFDAAWIAGRSPPSNFQDRNDATIAALTGRDRTYEPDDRTIDV